MVKDVDKQYFNATEKVSEEVWYWASLGSIITSMLLYFSHRKETSLFVGQWAPTFLLFGLFHKLLKPSH